MKSSTSTSSASGYLAFVTSAAAASVAARSISAGLAASGAAFGASWANVAETSPTASNNATHHED